MATPLLGWIPPSKRTQAQQDAHVFAQTMFLVRHALVAPDLPKGAKVILTDLWNHPDVVADVGRKLWRELQNTGSCVKVGGTNALRCTIAAQRVAADNPTLAFEPYCWHNYAMSRHYYGDDGEGDGSMGSTFFRSLKEDGLIAWSTDRADAYPDYTFEGDHIEITSAQEYDWSSYRNAAVRAMLAETRKHLMGGGAECSSPIDIKAMNLNGYGVAFACNNYIGSASVRGSGANARVIGEWNGRGGHQQWVFGYEENPELGPLYAVGNNWPDNTYPRDPGGLPLCCCWVTEAKVAAAMRLDSEVYGLSNLDWFSAAPKLLDYLI